jgi:hypothetical protein
MPMLVDVEPGKRLRFRLEGAIAEPKTARWRDATAAERLRYWPILADVLLANWRAQMLAGRGRRGKVRQARAISRLAYSQLGLESTGPGLLPQRERSRAYRLARVTPYADLGRVTGFWATSFGRVLSYHHTGQAGKGVPWFDDFGRIHWRGLPGQVTGIYRDIMPTFDTISASVIEAGSRWARLVGPTTLGGPASPRRAAARAVDFGAIPESDRLRAERYLDRLASGLDPTGGERDAAGVYTLNSDAINSYLRGEIDRDEAARQIRDEVALLRSSEAVPPRVFWRTTPEEVTTNLDRLIGRARLDEPLTLYRGVGARFAATLRAGGSFDDPSYQSTSINRETAAYFASERGGIVLRIRARPGQSALAVEPISPVSNGTIGVKEYTNYEVLLPRGSTIRIGRIATEGGVTYADATIVEADARREPEAPILPPAAAPPRNRGRFGRLIDRFTRLFRGRGS